MTDRGGLVLDVEAAIDDALAVICAANAGLLAVTCVAGAFTVEQAVTNTTAVLELVGRSEIPVFAGRDDPLGGIATLPAAKAAVHGETGTGFSVIPAQARLAGESAPHALARLARAHPGQITLVSGGRLTNLAVACDFEPELPSLLRRWVLMGGALDVPGTVTPLAEGNVRGDAVAADRCLSKFASAGQLPIVVALDVTTTIWFSKDELDDAAGLDDPGDLSPLRRFVRDALDFYALFHQRQFSRAGYLLHDLVSLAIALDPDLVVTADRRVDVELSGGDGFGMTILSEDAEPNAAVPVEVDVSGIRSAVLARLRQATTSPRLPHNSSASGSPRQTE